MLGGPFVSLDRQTVVGALKATGSRDLDVLYAARTKLLGVAAGPRWYGSAVAGVALLLGAGPLARLPAMLLLGVGLWLLRRGTLNIRMVKAGHAEYVELLRREKPRNEVRPQVPSALREGR